MQVSTENLFIYFGLINVRLIYLVTDWKQYSLQHLISLVKVKSEYGVISSKKGIVFIVTYYRLPMHEHSVSRRVPTNIATNIPYFDYD
jgi:uncharacterized membrane protein